MQKLMLSMVMMLGLFACAEQASEPTSDFTPDPAETSPEETLIENEGAPLELSTQEFACRIPSLTCTSTAQCDAMCGGPGTGVCNFRTLCCACRL